MANSSRCCQNRAVKLTQIRHLIAVADRGSLRRAAEDLGVSRAALLRSVRTLERDLGSALFGRGREVMVLTPVGEMFVRRAAAALRDLDRAGCEIGGDVDAPAQVLSIGLSASPHAAILPTVLPPFQSRFGDARLRIVGGGFPGLERRLREGTLDFYVGPIRPEHRTDGLRVGHLYDVARIVVGRKDHPLAGATSLAALAAARWIAPSQPDLDALFEQRRLTPPAAVIEVETALTMIPAVAASDALLILSASWSPLARQSGLAPFPLRDLPDPLPIHIATRAQPLTPAAAYLRDLILAAAADIRARAPR